MTQIETAIDAIKALHNYRPIMAATPWSPLMLETGQDLAQACGVQSHRAAALRPHEIRALFSAACQSDDTARALAAKQGWLQATPAPTGGKQGLSAEDVKALLDKARDTASEEAGAIADTAMLTVHTLLAGVPGIVADELAKLAPRSVEIKTPKGKTVKIERAHAMFERVLRYCNRRVWPYLVGPAGSGKTTLAENVATALGLPFYMAAKVQSEFALLGFMSPRLDGPPVATRTPFREAYEHGGVFLFDEMDASAAAALTAFNAALANGHCPFPDGLIKRHPDFIAIGAGNTMGNGRNREYVGRTQIDAATLDRFAFLNIEYDLALERALTPNQNWCRYVQAMRVEVEARNIRHIVSPRASINGSAMIAEGETWQEVANAIVFKGLDAETVQRLNAAVPMASFESE